METLLRLWCEGFQRRGWSVDCVVAHDRPRSKHERVNGVKVHRLAAAGVLLGTSLSPRYLAATRTYPADVWHAHFPNPLADMTCLLGQRSKPLVVTYHSDVIRQRGWMGCYAPLLNRYLSRASRVVVASPQLLDSSPWLQPFRDKCRVVPFGLDDRPFLEKSPSAEKWHALKREAEGKPVLLNVGRLVPYKGQSQLIEAMRGLDAVLWIAGTGPLAGALRQQDASLANPRQVVFLEDVPEEDLPSLYQACDVFAFPSQTPNEAFGLAQVEAMFCGRPVVGCRLPTGVSYVNRHGETGLLVEPGNTTALHEALRSLVDSPGLREEMGQRAREWALQEFRLEKMFDRYEAIFHYAMSGS